MTDTCAERLARLTDGYLTTQLLYVAAELGVAEVLAERPASAGEIAERVGADAGVLRRVLRGLAAEGVLDELPGGQFALSPVGELLRDDVPGSQRGAVLARGGLYYAALAGLLAATRSGATPFELVHGESFFSYLAARPRDSVSFQASMKVRAAREAEAVVAAYDFSRFHTLVDVGGGTGVLLGAIAKAAPKLSVTLFDRPEVVRATELPSVGGDFFVEVPSGADAYLLSRVIHDWDDRDAARILRTCRRAMPAASTLLLVEAVLPERAVDQPAAVRMDLHMLALLGGRERTADEYAHLLAAAGLRLVTVVPADPVSGVHVLAAHPVG